ncbi:raffinose/stachyose/melibiose transport system permease protein [Paenibacillus catalpae]|uniref:Raffinose/stachyose/melibiose transport system permease protein n=2 Tax=Paenibacillus catalpae TaxID=1045775 RepID=A0A1I2C260_9BACL|nr:sugar ABC transporter permease [Paenibacillus catalpae]SFE61833.1 raffinose/stachyose/melibiose transport system permease protein [Paenibacillus catalpae]
MNLRKRSNEWIQQLVFVGPGMIVFTIIVLIPFLLGFYFSFTEWNGLDLDKAKWIGMDNVRRIFTNDDKFWAAFKFTLKFTVVTVVVTNILALLLGLLLTRPMRGRNTLRTIFFLPNMIGGILLGYIWQFIFTKGFKTIGEMTGWHFFELPWLGTPETGFWGLVIVFVWQTTGYMMVIYIAAIVGVPKDLMEAATIDGATYLQTVRKIIMPLVMPAITVCLFLTTSGAFKMFDLNLSLTKGGPGTSTQSLAYNIYAEALVNNRYGLGTAKAMLFFFAVSIIAVTQVWLTKRKEVEA